LSKSLRIFKNVCRFPLLAKEDNQAPLSFIGQAAFSFFFKSPNPGGLVFLRKVGQNGLSGALRQSLFSFFHVSRT